jgi:8-oxo-dGTP pyrophosphatase MutT (NUDIX family)
LRNVSHAGVLPYRMKPSGPEFLLVTTRSSKRWSIPKGHCEAAAEARETALSEAYEEAGLSGAIPREPIGTFSHVKRGPPDNGECLVLVYPMKVTRQAASWPEKYQRQVMWAGAREAAELVDAGLSDVIRRFAETLAQERPPQKRRRKG